MPKLGHPLHQYDSVTSTNDVARELAYGGAIEGTTVLAEQQTAGRGRQGRQWVSAAGQGLYTSIILRPRTVPPQSQLITLAAAIAVAETLAQDFELPSDIKWPNDVECRGTKISGILVESAIQAGVLDYCIAGIGVNLGQPRFDETIGERATSVFMETGRAPEAGRVLPPLLERLAKWYSAVLDEPGSVLSRWQNLSSYAFDCDVTVDLGCRVICGLTRGLTDTGALRVQDEAGRLHEVAAGEIMLRKSDPA